MELLKSSKGGQSHLFVESCFLKVAFQTVLNQWWELRCFQLICLCAGVSLSKIYLWWGTWPVPVGLCLHCHTSDNLRSAKLPFNWDSVLCAGCYVLSSNWRCLLFFWPGMRRIFLWFERNEGAGWRLVVQYFTPGRGVCWFFWSCEYKCWVLQVEMSTAGFRVFSVGFPCKF